MTHTNHPKYELLGFRAPFKVEPLKVASAVTTSEKRAAVTHGKMAGVTRHKKQKVQLFEVQTNFKLLVLGLGKTEKSSAIAPKSIFKASWQERHPATKW